MKICIGADLVPTSSNYNEFITGDVDMLIGSELQEILNNMDFRIFNLEVPLTDEETPIQKCGPNLIAPTSTISGIKKMGANLLLLGNNHIMDQGMQGLVSTINLLEKNDIKYIGGGMNLSESAVPYILDDNDKKIAIYSCCEREFSIAEHDYPGANPFDSLETPDYIYELKKKCDYTIVLYHGGKEHYRYPSPYLQKICRKLVEKGADLVITQHSHCIGCKEDYKNGTIIYGQGNFLFDRSKSEYWKTGVLVSVDTDDNFKVEYIPIKKENNAVRLANETDTRDILSGFFRRSEDILKENFIEDSYRKIVEEQSKNYLYSLCEVGIFYRILNKLSGNRMPLKIKSKRKLALINHIECEAHRESVIELLKERRK